MEYSDQYHCNELDLNPLFKTESLSKSRENGIYVRMLNTL